MYEYRITKSNPQGGTSRALEWTSFQQVGQLVTRSEYEEIEQAYVEHCQRLLEVSGDDGLKVEGLETSGPTPVHEGQRIGPRELADVIRGVLRGQFRCRLEGARSFIHFGGSFDVYLGMQREAPIGLYSSLLFTTPARSPYHPPSRRQAETLAGDSDEVFLNAILENPYDLNLRLVYADWLEEQGDPRAELIRLQIALTDAAPLSAERDELEARERELLQEHSAGWRPPQIADTTWGPLRQGFHETLRCRDGHHFVRVAEAAFAAAPVTGLLINGTRLESSLPAMCASPLLGRITRLMLTDDALGPAQVETLVQSEHLAQLVALDLWNNPLDEAGMARLATARFPGLESLGLGFTGVGASGCEQLANSERLTQLRALDLSHAKTGDRGVSMLARSKTLARLETLDLQWNGISKSGVRWLASSKSLDRLKTLILSGNPLEDAGVGALEGAQLVELEGLVLAKTSLGPVGLNALRVQFAEQLRSLVARGNTLANAGARVLAHSDWPRLTRLDLASCGITVGGARALAECRWLAGLKTLDLSYNPLGPEGVQALAGSPYLGGLRHLNLQATGCDAQAVLALADSSLSPRATLTLKVNRFDPQGTAQLKDRFGRRGVL